MKIFMPILLDAVILNNMNGNELKEKNLKNYIRKNENEIKYNKNKLYIF
jgi:hypothetical protein